MAFRQRADRIAGAILAIVISVSALLPGIAVAQEPHLIRFLGQLDAASLVEGADRFGPVSPDLPVAPILRRDETVGWVYINSDFVRSTGYSGRPIHVMVALDPDARILDARIMEMSEPILVTGIAPQRIGEMLESFTEPT